MKLQASDTLTNSQWLVILNAFPDVYWTTGSSIEMAINRGTFPDPISATMRTTASGALTFSDMTVSKSFDALTDMQLLTELGDIMISDQYLSGSMTPVTRNGGMTLKGSQAIDLENLRIKSVNAPGDVNVGDGATVSTITVVLTVENINFQGNVG